ncbi:MAG: glycosyltransferase family 39 protein [Candidatus Omnitrophica bacterium]|nr:glycosyltransferase family 39 protein [Candidatus Omnitrophota bacterium]
MALDRRYWIWDLVLLLALSTALRAHNLGALSFCSEEADNALIARTCLQTGHFIQPESQPSSDGLLYPWITASLFNHFGESEWIARFPSAFFGALTTLWVYLWASHWFGSWVGRCAGFLFAVWPWSVAWGRIGQYESLLAFLFVLIVVSVWKMLECNCLGHPMAEPPRVAGRRPLTIRRFFKLIPFLLLALLAHFTSYLTHFALFFLPGYLLIRLSWSWFRGRFIDSEFKRSLSISLCRPAGRRRWNSGTGLSQPGCFPEESGAAGGCRRQPLLYPLFPGAIRVGLYGIPDPGNRHGAQKRASWMAGFFGGLVSVHCSGAATGKMPAGFDLLHISLYGDSGGDPDRMGRRNGKRKSQSVVRSRGPLELERDYRPSIAGVECRNGSQQCFHIQGSHIPGRDRGLGFGCLWQYGLAWDD